MTEPRHYKAETGDAGTRLDRFLSAAAPDLSRTFLQELIRAGNVSVNDRITTKRSFTLDAGDLVSLSVPEPEVPDIRPEEMPLDILYEDRDLLIVNKPKNLTVHPAPGHMSGTLVNGILWHCGDGLSGINGVLRPGIVHRIDKDTTGALIVCKTDAAHRSIAAQLKVHSVTRRYRGIVCGNIAQETGTVTGNIGRSRRDRKKMAVVTEGGKRAVTHYRVLEHFKKYCYCEFELETGRTHQIRVHMASIGHPLLGDAVYGPEKSEFETEGQTLHAMTIGFIHPTTGKYMEFTAPLPDYFEKILRTLRARETH